jgi:hypothetical protein
MSEKATVKLAYTPRPARSNARSRQPIKENRAGHGSMRPSTNAIYKKLRT